MTIAIALANTTRPRWSDRRVSPRFPCNLETSPPLIAALGNDFYLAKVRNISPEGISLVVNRTFEAGTILAVDLMDKRTNQFSDPLEVIVRYDLEHPNGEWILGGQFSRKLNPQELRIFLA